MSEQANCSATAKPAEIAGDTLLGWGRPLGTVVREGSGFSVEIGKRRRYFSNMGEMLSFAGARVFHIEERKPSVYAAYVYGDLAGFVHRRAGGFALDRGPAGGIVFETLNELIRWGIEKTINREIGGLLSGGVRVKRGDGGGLVIYRDEKRLAKVEKGNNGSLIVVYSSIPHTFDRIEKLLTWAHEKFGQTHTSPVSQGSKKDAQSLSIPRHLPPGCAEEIAQEFGIKTFTPEMYQAMIEILTDMS